VEPLTLYLPPMPINGANRGVGKGAAGLASRQGIASRQAHPNALLVVTIPEQPAP